MTSNPNAGSQQPMNIFLAVDGSENSMAAVQMVSDLPLPPDSTITALSVLTARNTPGRAAMSQVLDQAKDILQKKGMKVATGLLHGQPAHALASFAEENNPDLIALGATGLRAQAPRSSFTIPLGGVAQQMVEYAQSPVLIVRKPYQGLRRVLLVVDGSTASQAAAAYLEGELYYGSIPYRQGVKTELPSRKPRFPFPSETKIEVMYVIAPSASEDEAELAAWHAEDESHGQGVLDGTIAALRGAGIDACGVLKRGDAATEILEYVRTNSIDLIVAGSRGLNPIRSWLLGSVSRKLVHYAPCSVLIVKGHPEPKD